MSKVPMPNLDWIPSPNYSVGRQGNPVKNITFHHVVGSALSAVNKFKLSSAQTSAHFIVASNKIYCMVDTDDTAWTNGNWNSNLVSVTIEHEGDWRNGYRNEGVINQSVILNAWLIDLYPNATPNRHRDVASTACPSDFPVEEVWNKAKALRATYYAPPADNRPEWLKNRQPAVKTMYIARNGVRLLDLVTFKPADGRVFTQNQRIDIGSVTQVAGKTYYISEWSTDHNAGAGYFGGDILMQPYVEPPKPTDPPITPPAEVDPEAGKDWAKENNGLLKQILALLQSLVAKITSIFK